MTEKTVDVKNLEEIANRTRINVVKMIARSGIGHLGGSVSIAEILAVLYFYEMKNKNYRKSLKFLFLK